MSRTVRQGKRATREGGKVRGQGETRARAGNKRSGAKGGKDWRRKGK